LLKFARIVVPLSWAENLHRRFVKLDLEYYIITHSLTFHP
jgi:hypothetical protein